MSASKASLMSVKLGDGEVSESFSIIGGLQQFDFNAVQQLLDNTTVADDDWRNLSASSGQRFLRISVSGIYTDSATEQQVCQYALSGEVANYQCCFANGNVLQGAFIVEQYQRRGNIQNEERVSIVLQSAGTLMWL